mmetsp:Transcript_15054/g.34285  ORF Transcript_15054/g.34285 Transcript_15054/m.34285 type:complete len:230 (-) Transcript_15054:102-791(-)
MDWGGKGMMMPMTGKGGDGWSGGWGGGKGKGGCCKGKASQGKMVPQQPSEPPDPNKVFVGALKGEPTEATIREYFCMYGEITDVKMMVHENGASKGYCFVTFADPESVNQVFENYSNHMINGSWVDCKPAAGESKTKPGDWFCPMCGDLVFASKASCNSCGYGAGPMGMCGKGCKGKKGGGGGKAGGGGPMPGDWTCESCGDLVFAKRTNCKMCGAPRPQNGMMRSSPY